MSTRRPFGPPVPDFEASPPRPELLFVRSLCYSASSIVGVPWRFDATQRSSTMRVRDRSIGRPAIARPPTAVRVPSPLRIASRSVPRSEEGPASASGAGRRAPHPRLRFGLRGTLTFYHYWNNLLIRGQGWMSLRIYGICLRVSEYAPAAPAVSGPAAAWRSDPRAARL